MSELSGQINRVLDNLRLVEDRLAHTAYFLTTPNYRHCLDWVDTPLEERIIVGEHYINFYPRAIVCNLQKRS